MKTSTEQPPTNSVSPATPSLWLTPCEGEEGPGRFELPLGATTIGGGPRCTVKVRGKGVRPLHCVVTHSAHGTSVRRWAAGTEINGHAFTEASLSDGDRLAIAGFEFVVEAQPQPSDEARTGADTLVTPPAPSAQRSFLPAQVMTPWLNGQGNGPVSPSEIDPATHEDPQEPRACESEEESQPLAEVSKHDSKSVRHAAKQRVKKLSQRLREAQRDKVSLDEQLASLRNAKEQVDQALEASQLEVATAKDEVVGRIGEIESLRGQLAAADDQLFELRSAAVIADSRHQELAEEIAELTTQLQSAREELAAGLEDRASATSLPDEVEVPVTPDEPLAPDFVDELAFPAADASEPASPESQVNADDVPVETFASNDYENPWAVEQVSADAASDVAASHEAATEFHEANSPASADLWAAVVEPTQDASDLTPASAEPETSSADLWDIETTGSQAEPLATSEEEVGAENPVEAAEATVSEAAADWLASFEAQAAGEKTTSNAADALDDPAAPSSDDEPHDDGTTAHNETPEDSLPVSAEVTPASPDEEDAADEPVSADWLADLCGTDDDDPLEEHRADAASSNSLLGTQDGDLAEALGESASEEGAGIHTDSLLEPLASAQSVEELIPQDQPSTDTPSSFIEQYANLLPADEEPAEQVAPTGDLFATPTPPSPEPESSGNALLDNTASPSGEGDDSIEDYMAGLLERIRGEASAEQASAPVVQQPVPEASPKAGNELKSEPPSEPKEPLANLDELRSGPAPEQSHDMSALRALANQSARSAIGVADSRQNQEKAMANLIISGMAMLCGGYLAVTASSLLDAQFIGGLAGFGWAGYWGTNTLRHMAAASQAKEQGKSQPEEQFPISGVEPDASPK